MTETAPASVVDAAAVDAHSRCLEAAARDLGIPTAYVQRPSPGAAERAGPWLRLDVGDGSYVYRRGVLRRDAAGGGLGPHINGAALAIIGHKAHTKHFLAACGVAVPVGALFTPADAGKARTFFRCLGRPVCVKPNQGRRDAPMAARVEDNAAFAAAFAAVAAHTKKILVEESVEGDVVRFVYVAPRVAAVAADGIHPSYAAVAEAAGRAIPGVQLAGIDMMLREPARPAAPGNHWVLKIVGSPAIAALPQAATAIAHLLMHGPKA